MLKEWLNLLIRTRNLKSFYKNDFLKEVLERRLVLDFIKRLFMLLYIRSIEETAGSFLQWFCIFTLWLYFTRLLDDNDAEIQSKVLDCLLIWKDDFLIPYDQHLKSLISPKTLREELTRWSLSREKNQIDERHRPYLVPLVTRLLMPKVRKLKVLGSRKVTSLLGTVGWFILKIALIISICYS